MNGSSRIYSNVLSFFFISISFFGLCLLYALTFKVQISAIYFPLQRQLIGSIFGAICILGIAAGVFPTRCSRMFHFKGQEKRSNKIKQTHTIKTTKFSGHHPTCGNFSDHTLCLNSRTYCTGCTGLILGAIIALIGSFLYFFYGFHLVGSEVTIFWLGFMGVTCGLLQYSLLNLKNGAARLFLNAIFVLGAFSLLIGVNKITDNLIIEFYLLILIVYWIMTRIILSQREHGRICNSCSLKSCDFS